MKFNLTTEQAIADFDNFVAWAERAWKQGQDVGRAGSSYECPVATYLHSVVAGKPQFSVGAGIAINVTGCDARPLSAELVAMIARIDSGSLWQRKEGAFFAVDAYQLQHAAHQVKSAFTRFPHPTPCAEDREAEREAWWTEKVGV